MKSIGDHAVVVGGGISGLVNAAALGSRFHKVTIVERDKLPVSSEHRKGVPQGQHVHVLLPAGLKGLNELFPGIVDDLRAQGAEIFGASALRFHIGGGRLLLDDAKVDLVAATRPLIEAVVRGRVRGVVNIVLVDACDLRGLVLSPDRTRVTGVKLQRRTDASAEVVLPADLVVDASGRGSMSPRWLSDHGYMTPRAEQLRVGVNYTTRMFRRAQDDLEGCRNVTVATPPHGKRGGVALAVEGDRWIVTLIGILGERAPADLEGFREYARSLWSTDIHSIVASAEPLGEASTGAFPANTRRHYSRLRRFPGRYVVTGDAVSSSNPVYALGMSVAINEALTLEDVLDQHGLDRVGQRFYRSSQGLVNTAWTMATDSDLAHPGVEGPRTLRWRMLNTYIGRVIQVAHRDPVVSEAFLAVMSLTAPPASLMQPRILRRVLTRGRGAREMERGRDAAPVRPPT